MNALRAGYGKLVKGETALQSAVLLLVRVAFGYQFMLTGYGKIANIERTIGNFAEWSVPMPHVNAYMAAYTEMICGALLLLGFASRITAIPLVFTMIVAYATAHRMSVMNVFHAIPNKDGSVDDLWERWRNLFDQAPFPFLCAALVVVVFGAGMYSVDGVIAHVMKRRAAAPGARGEGARRI